MLERRLADGERVIGKKIGVTSKAVQRMLDVHQPDFGFLTDAMVYESGGDDSDRARRSSSRGRKGEIAFVLARDLARPRRSRQADVLAATRAVRPCFEIVDSRIRDWKIRIEDTVADNASSGVFVLGARRGRPAKPRPRRLPHRGGEERRARSAKGAGAAALGSPAYCVAWLANTLARFGIPLECGRGRPLGIARPARAGSRRGPHAHVARRHRAKRRVEFS